MKFCTSCGKALEFFEFLDGELCSTCLEKQQTGAPPAREVKPEPAPSWPEDLAEAHLLVEADKIVLKSPEGWVLWSGSRNQEHRLQGVLERAGRIQKIRKKRRN